MQSRLHTLEEFLGEASGAVVIEDGAVMFDLAQSKYSISGEHQQVPAPSVVAGAEYRAACRRRGGEKRHIAPCRAAPRPVAAYEVGNLPGARPALSYGEAGGAASLRGQTKTGHRKTFSRVRDLPPHHPSGSGEIVWPDLRAWLAAARLDRLCPPRRECFRDAELDRCGLDLRDSVARSVPGVFCRKIPG